jgi:hypothetical protein
MVTISLECRDYNNLASCVPTEIGQQHFMPMDAKSNPSTGAPRRPEMPGTPHQY